MLLEKICKKKGGGRGSQYTKKYIYKRFIKWYIKKQTEQESQKRFYWVNMQQKDESSSPLHASLVKGLMIQHFISTMKPEQLIWFPYCSSSSWYSK